MKVLITGGHVTPAISIIESLPKEVDVVYVGRKHALEGDTALSLEYTSIRERNIPFIIFHPGRIQRTWTRHTLSSAFRIPSGVIESIRILRKERPDVVLSFGGYVALPIALSAYMLRIPILTHEQTLRAGASNKLIAKLANTVCISWQTSAKYFPKNKTVLTGNPMPMDKPSENIQKILKKLKQKTPFIVITGGSLGSHSINSVVEGILPKLLEKYTILHQTGDAQEFLDYSRLMNIRRLLPKQLQSKYEVVKFIDPKDMTTILRKADLVIGRSGINTVQLLLTLNKPALLIPLATGQKNEQKINADFFAIQGLGEELSQTQLTADIFLKKIEQMVEKRSEYTCSRQKEFQALHENASQRIIECIYALFQKDSKKT